ncbi:META domain-containing protein [Maricaulaceae bacterium EIL42A08]|nr:META domain-containing protein [Maricaulaceae bacterium EIL42A08]
MTRLLPILIPTVLGSALLYACAPTPSPAPTPEPEAEAQTESRIYTAGLASGSSGAGVLDGTRWVITGLPSRPMPFADRPSMAFDNMGVTGSTGCNRYFGGISVDEREILIAIMRVSRRACAPEVLGTEQAVLEALASADGFALYGQDRLEISAGGRVVIEAAREP